MNIEQFGDALRATVKAMQEDAKISIEITKKGSETIETVTEAEGSHIALVGMLSVGMSNIINEMAKGDKIMKDTAIKTIVETLGYDAIMIRSKESK